MRQMYALCNLTRMATVNEILIVKQYIECGAEESLVVGNQAYVM